MAKDTHKAAHKPAKSRGPTYRLRPQLQPLAEQLAKDRAYDVTDLINEAVRKELELAGLWPPKPAKE